MGGGTTEYVVCSKGIIRHSGVLTIGGDHITNDLAIGLKISFHRAEKLKREHGSAIVVEAARDQMASVTDDRSGGRDPSPDLPRPDSTKDRNESPCPPRSGSDPRRRLSS